jgi:Helix-turn-helix domain of resolvase
MSNEKWEVRKESEMPVAIRQETPPLPQTQMELPIAVLLKLVREERQRVSERARTRFSRVRGDSLPEKTGYQDDGCEVSPQCLTCPLPRCRYDEPGGLIGLLNGLRDREIVALRSRGMAIEEIASTFAVSRRTVFRVLTEKYKEARCA